MAITFTLLNSNGSDSNAASYASDSVSPGANKLILCVASVAYTASSGQNTPTCSGSGLTWSLINSTTAVGAGAQQFLGIFGAKGASPSTGAITVSFGGQTQQNGIVYIVEVDGFDGADVAAAIVQSAVNQADATGTSLAATLAAFGHADNACFVAYACGDNVTITEEGGGAYTKLTQNLEVTESNGAACAYRIGEDTSPSMSTGTSETGRRIVALEIKALVAGGGTGPTLYPLNSANAQGYGDVQIGGSAPSDATGATGWTVSGTAADNYSKMAFGVERAANTFGGTALPDASGPDNTLKDCFRAGPFTGDFAAGDWDIAFPVIAVDAGGTQDGAVRIRVWKSANADGSSATELTSGAVQLSTVTNLTTGTPQTSASATVTLPAITHGGTNYYLFFQLAWRITGQAS